MWRLVGHTTRIFSIVFLSLIFLKFCFNLQTGLDLFQNFFPLRTALLSSKLSRRLGTSKIRLTVISSGVVVWYLQILQFLVGYFAISQRPRGKDIIMRVLEHVTTYNNIKSHHKIPWCTSSSEAERTFSMNGNVYQELTSASNFFKSARHWNPHHLP